MIGRLLAVSLMVAVCFMFGRAVDALPSGAPPYPDPAPEVKNWDGWMQIDHPTYVVIHLKGRSGLWRCRVTSAKRWRCVQVHP